MCILYLIVYNFTRFRCTENYTQDHFFGCDGVLLLLYASKTKTRPVYMLHARDIVHFLLND